MRTPAQFFHALLLVSALALRATGAIADQPSAPAPIYPKALAPGDTIMFIAPAKYLEEPRMLLAKKRLEKMGFKVKMPDNLFRKQGFLAGSDDERAAELMAGFNDATVNAVFPGTGGYGTTRILDKLDYDAIQRNPKIFIGFSDITALHIAINQRTGLVTFHAPNPAYGLGNDDNLTPFAARWFWRALLAKSYFGKDGKPLPAGYTILAKPSAATDLADMQLFANVPTARTLRDGTARGPMIGGNLTVVHAMMGTPYEIQTDGKILFLEDVGEAPYRIDRMLRTLKEAGKFDHAAGIVLGCFTAREEEPAWDDDESVDDVINEYFGDLHIPVLAQFPTGHVRFNTTLPFGAEMELDATHGTLQLLENPVTLP
jgi:muramoyltetrapeptide carboxypeptidase